MTPSESLTQAARGVNKLLNYTPHHDDIALIDQTTAIIKRGAGSMQRMLQWNYMRTNPEQNTP